MPERIGKYEILAEIGKGGFGSVYRAYDSSLGRPVAIKILSSTGDPGLLARFRNEASAAGNLHHENIVTIYEFGEHAGMPFIAMELLAGEDLQRLIRERKPLTVLEKVRVMAQVASGLHCAHRSGVVHRDVKPANIMVLPDGLVKIMDFGIARLTGAGGTRLTHHGYVIGTLMYMAPEQFTDMEADPACDIFAYGIVFYEFLAGRHPFQAADVPSSIRYITTEDPPPIRELVPDCPIGLQDVVSRALEKDRELRYRSLQDLLFDLWPVQAELNRRHAGELTAGAREKFDAGDFTGAQEVLRQAMELDASNPDAGRLHDEIQKRVKREKILPRKAELLRTGEREFANRRYREALQCFDSALRLDSTDESARDGAARARAALEQSKLAASLIEQAHRELEAKDFTGAYRNASEALRAEPGNPSATRLVASIQQEIERRQGDRTLNDALGQARSLFLLEDFDGALAILQNLDDRLRQDEQVKRLMERILARKAGPQPETVQIPRPTAVEPAPGAGADGLRHALDRARELLEKDDVEPALRVLQMAAQRYPREPELESLFVLAQGRLRGRQVQAAVQECEALRRDRKLIAATEKLAGHQQQLGPDPLLLAVRARLDTDWREVQSAIALAAQQEESGQFEAALETIRGAQARFVDIPELRIIAGRLSKKAASPPVAPAAPSLNPGFWSATGLVNQQPPGPGFAAEPAWLSSGAAAAARMEPVPAPILGDLPRSEEAPRTRSKLVWFALGGLLLAALAASAAMFVLRRAPARLEVAAAQPAVKVQAPTQTPPATSQAPVAQAAQAQAAQTTEAPPQAEPPQPPPQPVEGAAPPKPDKAERARTAEPRRARRAKTDDEDEDTADVAADAAPQVPSQSAADDRSYNGPPRIPVAWAGALAPAAQLTLHADAASEGRITNGAILPQFSGTVEASPEEAQVVELPSRQNGFRVVIKNNSDHPLEAIKLIWRPAK